MNGFDDTEESSCAKCQASPSSHMEIMVYIDNGYVSTNRFDVKYYISAISDTLNDPSMNKLFDVNDCILANHNTSTVRHNVYLIYSQ